MSASNLLVATSFNQIDPNGMKFRGIWVEIAIYYPNDVVLYNGSSYVCYKSNTDVLPTDTDFWDLLGGSGGGAGITAVDAGIGSGILAQTTSGTVDLSLGLTAGNGISLTPSLVNNTVAIANTGVLAVFAGDGIAVDDTTPDAPIVSNTGVLDVSTSVGSGITIGGTAQHPTFANTGVLDLSAGTGITISGTAQHPIINSTATSYATTFIIDEFNGDANVTVSVSGAGVTSATVPIPTTNNIIDVSNNSKYMVSFSASLVSDQNSLGGSNMGLYIVRVDDTNSEVGSALSLLNTAESTQATGVSGAAVVYTHQPPAGNPVTGLRLKIIGENLVGTGSVFVYNLTAQQVQ